MATLAVVGLGASMGDRATTLELAARLLSVWPGIRVRRSSRLYWSAPVGGVAGAAFLNGAVLVATTLSPAALASSLREIEVRLGRRPTRRWADRVLDLDLLWMEGVSLDDGALTVPHPRLLERDFALVPLVEVAPEARDPRSSIRYAALAAAMSRLPIVRSLPRARPGGRS
ncbi:MAG: 2-amino-4-hydroxy-6-hydroxymethyldihydropteridine diphosphokinase [Myxococcales bacterium]|nr:2-amino-4-hydroxy-6-hydroxymethyldihydropteridine diphosphokinase [Myxococcales bacterium]